MTTKTKVNHLDISKMTKKDIVEPLSDEEFKACLGPILEKLKEIEEGENE